MINIKLDTFEINNDDLKCVRKLFIKLNRPHTAVDYGKVSSAIAVTLKTIITAVY